MRRFCLPRRWRPALLALLIICTGGQVALAQKAPKAPKPDEKQVAAEQSAKTFLVVGMTLQWFQYLLIVAVISTIGTQRSTREHLSKTAE